jgi:hypothetical protein
VNPALRFTLLGLVVTPLLLLLDQELLNIDPGDDGSLWWQDVKEYMAENADISLALDVSESDRSVTMLDGDDFQLWLFAEGEDPTSHEIGNQDVPDVGHSSVKWRVLDRVFPTDMDMDLGYYSVLRAYPGGLVLDYSGDVVFKGERFVAPEWVPFVNSVLNDLTGG